MSLFSTDDEKRISDAITAAERRTSGEIVAVVAPQSDAYLYVPFLVASLVALLVPWPLIHFTWTRDEWIYAIQLLVFATIAAALLYDERRRLWFVPRSIRRVHAHRRAVEQFMTLNLQTTTGRTGVLIFVSLAERNAEIVAERAIHAVVPEGTWQSIIDRLTADLAADKPADGFIGAIASCGDHLARHFPPGPNDSNELPNHLIVLG